MMGLSMIDAQRDMILSTIHHITKHDWKVLVIDPDSKKLLENVIEQDVLLSENITNVEQITERRATNHDVEALYFLTPQPHIVDCVMADFQRRKYKRAHLVWTSRKIGPYAERGCELMKEAVLHPALRDRIDKSQTAREQIEQFTVLNAEYYARESHMVTFRDPWSFPILFHPACNHLVRQHMEDVAQKIVGVCVALGEYPTIRYYRPRTPTHEASILCSHLARFVQDELDLYAKFHNDFPPPSTRPRGTLYITNRTMDLFAPFVHEFTYQAMAHDLLPIKEGDKITYRTIINEGRPNQEEKDIAITEKDKLWLDNRHRHMKDVIEKLMSDFKKFLADNPNFTNEAGDNSNSLNAIKDMMAGLPQFQEMKEAYALHLGMAQESMNRFQKYHLSELSAVEQVRLALCRAMIPANTTQICATGLDEDYKKPKGLADQVIRMLDEDEVAPPDRLRLLILFIIYRDGIHPADLQKLLSHAQLSSQDAQVINNLEFLGVRTSRNLKDSRPPPQRLFPQKPPPAGQEEFLISRYEPAMQNLLEAHATNSVDLTTFPYTKPPLDSGNELAQQSATSLRSAKPTWARARANVSTENRQRVIVFMAGGATYSESRVCYEIGKQTSRETFLVTSHMLTPQLFVRQVQDLSADKRRLGIPAEQPKPQAPAHLFEPDEQPKPPPQPQQAPQPQRVQQQPPTQAMGNMNLNGTSRPTSGVQQQQQAPQANSSAKLTKDPDKKKRHHFGFGKKDKY